MRDQIPGASACGSDRSMLQIEPIPGSGLRFLTWLPPHEAAQCFAEIAKAFMTQGCALGCRCSCSSGTADGPGAPPCCPKAQATGCSS